MNTNNAPERIDHELCEKNARLIIEMADKYQGWDCIDYPVAVAYLKMREAMQPQVSQSVGSTAPTHLGTYDQWCFEGMGRIQLMCWIQEKVFALPSDNHTSRTAEQSEAVIAAALGKNLSVVGGE